MTKGICRESLCPIQSMIKLIQVKVKKKTCLFPKILRNISRIFWLYRSFAKLSKCAKCFEIIFLLRNKQTNWSLICELTMAMCTYCCCTVYTLHCTYGQLFVLHCEADYHSGRVFVVVLRWCSSLSQRHFKLDNYVYSVGVKTTEML